MIWKKDKLKPTQPYFVLETDSFYQEIFLEQGISHFYHFALHDSKEIGVVPDGCIDMLFEYKPDGSIESYVCGSVLTYEKHFWESAIDVFGVRFMPGYQPAGLNVRQKDLVNQRLPLKELLEDTHLYDPLEQEYDFFQRIRIFLQQYTKAVHKQKKPYGKQELVLEVKRLVYQTDGKIKVSELQEQTGYSERYINKVFVEELGFSPKTFCKIIQFQWALEFLNYGAPDKMTDAAVALGYYDQAQFIRDFKKYAGMTPKKYLEYRQREEYVGRVRNIDAEGNPVYDYEGRYRKDKESMD